MKYYQIFLPLPTSVNASHTVGAGFRNRKTGKWTRVKTRSKDYRDWIEAAGQAWRDQFCNGISKQFSGRIGVVYIFVWPLNDPSPLSDIGNREKVLSDFLQDKFYQNDNQIDEQRHYRRVWGNKRPYVWVRIYEIPDSRYSDPALIFKA
ncbi:MAG TPA: RusA family crossover junction endodeoxyribonuclease [Pyrinomonadaceae bacterium]|nr:RusA family crossover junction endodeoxyribonuclease [Pyrinomonadaceae bacterium]